MLLVAKILTLIVLGLIFVQDMVSRAVYWFLFPILAMVFAFNYYSEQKTFSDYWIVVAFNLFFLILQLLLVSAWFAIKNRRWVNITKQLLGWGDVLFIACLAFCFSPGNFIIFYIISLMLVLLIWLTGRRVLFKSSQHIPLAGMQAFLLLLLFLFNWINPILNLSSDGWLIKALS